ncbi:MAG: S41 family peptidase [Phycisphaerales bacterium JB059]
MRHQRGLARTFTQAAAIGLLSIASSGGIAQDDVQLASVEDWSSRVWSAAGSNDEAALTDLLASMPAPGENPTLQRVVDRFESNLAKRDQSRAEKIEEASASLDEKLAEGEGDIGLSKALTAAVEMQLLMNDDDAFFADPRIAPLLSRAERAARAAEARADWLIANELFFRLSSIDDANPTYKEDLDRLTKRLTMIRMYDPERLWELRNNRRLAEGEDPYPPYNRYGDDFHEKLEGIDEMMIYRALQNAAIRYVERASNNRPEGVTLAQMLSSGLDAVETMATTDDLYDVFTGLGNDDRRQRFLAAIADIRQSVENAPHVGTLRMRTVIDDLLEANDQTVGVLKTALLHEFGNGALEQLDDYSAIIWPDELARFRRSTQGEFIGVGIQIQLDELQNIKVVTPLEGTPAQRAGIRSDDIIKKVDGFSTIGFTLDQAVEVITGPADTKVTLTIERESEEKDEPESIDFTLVRKRIDLPTVKGWSKTGAGDRDWNWFVDEGVGYVRLTGFTEKTTQDFDYAVRQMRNQGLEALVLDLRFNPGGLLDQAVQISNRFVDRGLIVRTEDADGMPASAPQLARPIDPARSLADIPVVVLINEGSASASEIVSGAIQAAAHQGKLQALVVGQRSFGKGSVQNVYPLSGGQAAMKLTTQYSRIDSPRMIHKRPGATEWGIDPDLEIQMLPDQITESLLLRREADVLPLDENGNIIVDADRPDPDSLLEEGVDLQVETALVLLQSQRSARKITAQREN